MATKKSELVLTCNATALKDVIKFLNKEMDELIKKRDALLEKGEQNWSDRERSSFKRWGDDIAAITSMMQKNRQEMVKYADVMRDLSQSKLRDLKKALNEGKRALEKMNESSHGRKQLIDGMQKIQKQIEIIGEKSISITKVTKQLNNLVNVPTEKLRQGLAAIRQELEKEPEGSQWSNYLKNAEKKYAAQIAINENGRAGNAPLMPMNNEQLTRERARLINLYSATDGVQGYEAVSQDAINRLHQVNQLIKDRADAERDAARAKREAEREAEKAAEAAAAAEQKRIDFARQGQNTHKVLVDMEKASYEDLDNALKHLETQRQKYIQAGDTKHLQRNLQMQDKLKQKMQEMQKLMLTDEQISDRVNNSKKYNVIELQQAYDQLKYKLTTLHTGEQQQIKETRKQMKSLEKDINAVGGEATGLTKIWQTAVRNIATYMGVFAIAGTLKTKIQQLVSDNLALSDSMAQVQKVTGLTADEVKRLNVNLTKMDTRSTIEQLNELAYSAGKMGLGKYGVDGIQQFVSAANQLQVALGDDLGNSVEESITPLAKLAENLGLFEKMGVEKAMTAIGSSINELSQTTTAAGRNIVDFARRIQPAAQMIGLTTDEILALGSASDSFGVSSEISATAFTKFLAAYRTNTEEIERILNMVPGTLDKFFDEGKTIDGLLAIFQRMHDMGDLRYLEDAFKALGSEGSRMFTTFGAFAKNVDMFREHLNTSTEAFNEATSVTREYNLVQENAQGIVERSNNIWKNAFVNPAGVDAVKALADEWYRLSKELTGSETWMSSARASLGLLLEAVKMLIEALPILMRLLFAYGMGQGLQMLVRNFMAIYRAVTLASGAMGKFNLLLKTNAISIGLTLLGYVLTKFIDVKAATDDAKQSVQDYQAAMERSQRSQQTYTSTMASNYASLMEKYDNLKRQWKSLKSEHEKSDWIKKNKTAFDELGLSVTDAASAEDVFEKNTARVVDGFKRRAEAAALAAQMTELYRQKMDVENEAQQLINDKGKEAGDKVLRQPAVMQRDKNASTFNNGQFILGRDGNYYYTSQGAEQYNRELLKAQQSEYNNIDKKINDAARRMEELGNNPLGTATTPTSGGNDNGNGGSGNGNKELTEKLKDAKEKAEGLIAKVDQWYNLQDATINDFAATGRITDEEAKQALDAMKIARNMALEKARLAVASGSDTDWKQFYQENMGKMMIDHGEWSTQLFEQIGEVDIKALHDFLSNIQDPDVMAKLDASSFFDTMRKKAADNRKQVSETQAKATQALNDMLLKYEYFDKAARQFADNLVQIGALGTTAEQMAMGMEGAPNAQQTLDAVKGMMIAMLQQGASLYAVNPADAAGVADMINKTATGTDGNQAEWFTLFPAVQDWLNDPEAHKKELEQIYNVMLQAEQDYYAKRKQSYENKKRQHETRNRAAGFTEREEKDQAQLKTLAAQKDAGIGATFMEQQGLGKIADDPEVIAIQNRIYWRNEDVKSAQARIESLKQQQQQELADLQAKQADEIAKKQEAGATLEEIDKLRLEHRQQIIDLEAAQNVQRMGAEDLLKEYQTQLFEQETALATKVSQELQKRVQTINTLTKPITDFTQAAGRKIGDMIFNMESEEATWEQLWKNMALAVGESVIQMGAQYAQNLLMQKAMNSASESEAVADAGVKVSAGIAAGSAKTIGELGWWGIPLIGVISALLMGLLQSALSTKGSKDSSSSTTKTKVKLASGMLTYDEGNIGTYRGTDGQSYRAAAVSAPADGLVTQPIATTVQGQPALVAERGPEIVIGRRTTRAIMMNEPGLIKYLANYGKSGGMRRTFDSGNLDDITTQLPDNAGNAAALTREDAAALTAAIGMFNQTVGQLQQKGIPCYINKYGTGGLIDEVKSGLKFDAKYNKS